MVEIAPKVMKTDAVTNKKLSRLAELTDAQMIQMAGTVKVVSPPELVEEIRETIRKMAAEYQV